MALTSQFALSIYKMEMGDPNDQFGQQVQEAKPPVVAKKIPRCDNEHG